MTVETKPEGEIRERVLRVLKDSGLDVVDSDSKSVLVSDQGREYEVEVYVNDVTGWRDET